MSSIVLPNLFGNLCPLFEFSPAPPPGISGPEKLTSLKSLLDR